ncbi:hypothetical protein [Streptomyces sp. NPDC057686]|uniref:hypothetical protein n=1 Tax=Streptomyces sp. NPDC057686 TaxID=3346212 RepID=UPI0036B1FEEB
MTTTQCGELNSADATELEQLAQRASQDCVEGLLEQMNVPCADLEAVAELAARCTFDHVAALVFPRTLDEVRARLAAWGWTCAPAIPSVVVRGRLAQRHGLRAEDLDVWIIRARKEGQPDLEVFCLLSSPALAKVAVLERAQDHERHLALRVNQPDLASLEHLTRVLGQNLAILPDGGGHNPHEDREAGGRTVLYFRHPHRGRVELTCSGAFPNLLDRHLGR